VLRRQETAVGGHQRVYGAHTAEIFNCLQQIAQIRTQLQPGFTQFNTLKRGFSAVALAVLLVFILTGAREAAAIALLVGLIAIAILLTIALVQILSLKRRIMLAQYRLITLNLQYYRSQLVRTCLRVTEGDDEGDGDWCDELWELMPARAGPEGPARPIPGAAGSRAPPRAVPQLHGLQRGLRRPAARDQGCRVPPDGRHSDRPDVRPRLRAPVG
jgi:hypothetical protein